MAGPIFETNPVGLSASRPVSSKPIFSGVWLGTKVETCFGLTG
jgi:hypothetical protein